MTSFPVYLASRNLVTAMRTANLNGYTMNPSLRITFEEQSDPTVTSAPISQFQWIEINGTEPTTDDLLIAEDLFSDSLGAPGT